MSQKQQGTVGPVAGEGEGEVEGGGGGRRESGSSQAAGGHDNGAAGNGDRDQGRTSSSSAAATDGQQSGAGAGAGAVAGGSRVVQDQGGGMDGVDDDDDDDDEAKPQIPRRQFKPVKGVVDRHGRRNALDFGMPPERELEKPSRLDILYPKPKKKKNKQEEVKATSKSPDEDEKLAGEVERLTNIAEQMKQLTEAELREQVDALKEELAKAKEKVGKRMLLQEVRRRASLRMDVISVLQEDGQLLVPAGGGVGAGPPEKASADQSGAEAGAAIDVTKLGDAIEEGEHEGEDEEGKEVEKEGEDGEKGEGDDGEDEDEDEEASFGAAPEQQRVVHLQEELEQHLPKQEYKGPPRPRSTLQNAVGWFVRRRDGYYIPQDEDEAGEAGAGDASGAAGSGLSAVMARKKPENRGERRAEDYRRMKPKQRRNRAATSIQRCFRVFQMHRKFYILTNKKRRDELARLGVDPFETEQFGPDSLAKRKPIEVAKYLKENKIENFIVEQVKGFLTQPNLSTNPYPELLIRMRMRQIIDTEFLRIGYRDEDYHKKFIDNADNVQDRNREGQLLAAAYFTNLEPTRTFWGEKHMMQVVDALALDQIRNALGTLVESKAMDLGENHRLVIGQALIGRVIFHMSSSPFPASIELSEEVVGIGKNFEKIINAYVEHVIQDIESFEVSCSNAVISGVSVGIATSGGDYQRFSSWSLKEIRARRKAFITEFNNSTVNKRPNNVDLLIRVKMREIPGAQSLESEQAVGGWGFITCRKSYTLHYQTEDGAITQSYHQTPFISMYKGLFFDKDFAQLYASKRVEGEKRGSMVGGVGKVMQEELVKDYLDMADNMVRSADREGDIMVVAENSLIPAMIREALGISADDAQLVRCQRLRSSGAAKVRTMCDHMYSMQKALDLISEAQERVRIEKEQEGLIRETEPSPRAKAGGFDIATTMRIVMGQLTWLTRELGDLVGLCIGGIDLDALAVQILTRFNRLISEWTIEGKMKSTEFSKTLDWARNVSRSCYLSHAHSIFKVDPVKVQHLVSVDAIQKFEKLIIKDVVNVEQEVEREIKSLTVPKGKAKETVLLRYVADTGMDSFLEGLLRALTEGSLFPNPRMRAMRHMRSYSQYFLLWKCFNLDILNTFARLMAEVKLCQGTRAKMLHTHQCQGLPYIIPPTGQPDPRMPQPGLWTPTGTKPPPPAFGTRVALMNWFATLAAVGAGAEPRKKKDGGYEVSSGAAARGGAHFNTGYNPKLWWLAHSDVIAMVESLRNLRPFPKSAYTLRIGCGLRKICVHPAPYVPILHLRFARASLYDYYDIEGPKKLVAVQLACSHFLQHVIKLHDATPHVPFGVYIAPKKNPDSAPPAGLAGALGDLEMPGAGHVIWSPSQCKQLQDTVLTDMREAIMEGRCVYSVGLYLQKPRYVSGDNAQEISSSDPQKAKEAEEKEKQIKSTSGYILYTTHLMVSYSTSTVSQGQTRKLMPGERELYWPRDDHAMHNLVFFSQKEAMEVMALFPLSDHEQEPCSETNAQQHYDGLKTWMSEFAHEGNFIDLMHAVMQRGFLVSLHLDLVKIMDQQNAYEKSSKAAFSSGRHYLDNLFARKQIELSAMADSFRIMHSTTENLNTLQWIIITLGAILAIQAPEVRMKIKLKTLLVQTTQLKRRLTNLLLEEPNKIYMNGLHRSMYLRIDEILDNMTTIVANPTVYADPVVASMPTREEHFVGPDMSKAPDVVEGKMTTTLRAMHELHSKLAALTLAVSRTSYESCEVVISMLKMDEKKRVEKNTAERIKERNKEEEAKVEREKRYREVAFAELKAEEGADEAGGDGGRSLKATAAKTAVKAGVAKSIWGRLNEGAN